ncbi:MAG TPA: TonB-dependent receptor [Pyrinomonadaceae bacterium]|nr:TonB-dependent receptor [Pyrinomonadaceae bacterium]
MRKNIKFISLVLSIVFCFAMTAFGQETRGEIQGTVKDPAGAVIPNASITIRGVDVGFNRTIQADGQGFYRAREIPPGIYNVSVAEISGFLAQTRNNVQVALGNATTVDFTLATTGVTGEVTVTVDSGVIVDATGTKAQDNISAREIEALPKGTGFTSLLRTTASVRPEPISGQFSINGATGPENSFIIDGQETQNFRTGVLNGNNDVPFQSIQEIQVKSSGFEAEFGGATGGVINAVTKSGTNQFRGEIGVSFGTSKLDAGPRPVLSVYAPFAPVSGSVAGSNQGVEYFPQERDKYHEFYPSVTLGGPVIKDRLWFFGIYAPRTSVTDRTTNFIQGFGPCPAPAGFAPCRAARVMPTTVPVLAGAASTQTSRFKRTVEYAQIKLDASPVNTVRISSSYTWNPIVDEGNFLGGSFVNATPSFGIFNGTAYQGADLAALQGGRQNSNNFRIEGNWVPTSKFTSMLRYSRGFLNEKLGGYGIPLGTRIQCAAGGSSAVSGCPTGFQTTNNNSVVVKDVSLRTTIDANASYLVGNFAGRHEFKGGYQFSRIFNDVQRGHVFNGGWTALYYDTPGGTPRTLNPSFLCLGAFPVGTTIARPTGAAGVGCNYRFGTIGEATNTGHAFFFQDKWQPTNRLTLNLGVRTESEKIPAFNGVSTPGLEFSFSEKLAPRLGAAYALTADGKTKISAFYGWFYDRLKFELPRGSFGGDYYHVDFFYIGQGGVPTNYQYYTQANVLGNYNPPLGGQCPTGGIPITAGTLIRCDTDYRIPSNIGFPGAGAVDDNLEPYRQSELTVEFQREVMRASVFTARYLRRNLDQVVEDAGVINASGSEAYIIGNPGRGLHLETLKAAGYEKSVEAVRKYNALQLEVDTRYFRNFSLNINYVLSRLEGNYSGLGGSDENGRVSPNVLRAFDLPQVGFNASGQPDYGVLGLDRTHVFKASGTYTFDWWRSNANSTDISFFTTVQSGLPQTSFVSVFHIPIPLGERNDLGRTEMFTQTDLNLSHRYRFGRDNRFAVAFDFNVINVLNENNVLGLQTNLTQNSYFDLGFSDVVPSGNPVAATNVLFNGGVRSFLDPFLANPEYRNQSVELPNQFQAPRSVRFGARFIF